MEKLGAIVWRLIKVIYVVVLLVGILWGWFLWETSKPVPYYTYIVKCNSGKTFDPTSKPIETIGYVEPYSFNAREVASECQFGTAYFVGAPNLDINNNIINYQTHVSTSAQNNQLEAVAIGVVVYYVVIEILKRTFLYIFIGKNFWHPERPEVN